MADDTATKIQNATKVQIAADLIADEMYKRGTPTSLADCLTIARRLHEIWACRDEAQRSRELKPGEVAQRFKERYID